MSWRDGIYKDRDGKRWEVVAGVPYFCAPWGRVAHKPNKKTGYSNAEMFGLELVGVFEWSDL